ncbi:unnamed protein product [Rotaria sordida]|uniref:Uncharacterized protein n=1 Tax=Rotaria sordida TaxID=392033 RepID=A0A819M9K1_9BILA|nr:unnamed protein product [Rotaria sordida]CAF3975682.1 unnamed protein product [Rotaria sordida]
MISNQLQNLYQIVSTVKLLHRTNIIIHINIEQTPKTETTQTIIPVTLVHRFNNLLEQYTSAAQHIKQYKQRLLELD